MKRDRKSGVVALAPLYERQSRALTERGYSLALSADRYGAPVPLSAVPAQAGASLENRPTAALLVVVADRRSADTDSLRAIGPTTGTTAHCALL